MSDCEVIADSEYERLVERAESAERRAQRAEAQVRELRQALREALELYDDAASQVGDGVGFRWRPRWEEGVKYLRALASGDETPGPGAQLRRLADHLCAFRDDGKTCIDVGKADASACGPCAARMALTTYDQEQTDGE